LNDSMVDNCIYLNAGVSSRRTFPTRRSSDLVGTVCGAAACPADAGVGTACGADAGVGACAGDVCGAAVGAGVCAGNVCGVDILGGVDVSPCGINVIPLVPGC